MTMGVLFYTVGSVWSRVPWSFERHIFPTAVTVYYQISKEKENILLNTIHNTICSTLQYNLQYTMHYTTIQSTIQLNKSN